MTDRIGKWTRRARGYTLWHFIESEIADRVVTTCGRQMRSFTQAGGLEYADEPHRLLTPVCHNCRKQL